MCSSDLPGGEAHIARGAGGRGGVQEVEEDEHEEVQLGHGQAEVVGGHAGEELLAVHAEDARPGGGDVDAGALLRLGREVEPHRAGAEGLLEQVGTRGEDGGRRRGRRALHEGREGALHGLVDGKGERVENGGDLVEAKTRSPYAL